MISGIDLLSEGSKLLTLLVEEVVAFVLHVLEERGHKFELLGEVLMLLLQLGLNLDYFFFVFHYIIHVNILLSKLCRR